MNKRGSIIDLFTGMGLLLAVAFIAFISASVGSSVLGGLKNTSAALNPVVNNTLNAGIATSQLGDVVFLILFAGWCLAMLVSSMSVDHHPAWFFIFVILSILGVVIAAPISNAYVEISQSDAMVQWVPSFPITDMIMTNLPFIIMLIAGGLLIWTYAKQRTTI